MTKREKEILKLIGENPMISQSELAEKLRITRSSTGVHISNLMKKGRLKGKGYIINHDPYICVLGGANIDIVGCPHESLTKGDTTPGFMQMALGGVGRNISENLVRLGIGTKFISAIGDDFNGKQIINNCSDLNIDISDCLYLKDTPTSVLLAIMDKEHNIALGISAMDLYEKLDIDFLRKKSTQIEQSRITVIDTNISESSIDYITSKIKANYFLDTVSSNKAHRAKKIINKVNFLKASIREASILWGEEIKTSEDLKKAGQYFLDLGIQKVFITMGDKGVFYCDPKDQNSIPAKKVNIVNTNGAGDAFCAGVLFGIYNGFSTKKCVNLGMQCAEMTVGHNMNVNPEITDLIVDQL